MDGCCGWGSESSGWGMTDKSNQWVTECYPTFPSPDRALQSSLSIWRGSTHLVDLYKSLNLPGGSQDEERGLGPGHTESKKVYFGPDFPGDPSEASWGSCSLCASLKPFLLSHWAQTQGPGLSHRHTPHHRCPLPPLPALAPTPYAMYLLMFCVPFP